MAITSTEQSGMLTGLFPDRDSAERAYQVLIDRGYTKNDVNVVMSDETRKNFPQGGQTELGNKAAEGAGIGGATGGALGALLAAVTAAGTSLILPGLGLVIAGPLAAAAAGAGVGAATGGLIGALIGWGIPEERVKRYESGLKQGGILIGVKPRSREDADYIEQQWRDNNGQDIHWSGRTGTPGHAIVGVYDNYSDAENAIQALVAAGFPRSDMELTPESAESTQAAAPASEQRHGGVGGFFRSLFGMDEHQEHQEHRDVYAESVRRGSFVLKVDADTEDETDRASEIMERFNAIDIDERAGYWRKQGWAGYDVNAPRYTRDEIEKERSGYAQMRAAATGATEAARIPVVAEELKVGKRVVERGGIRVFRHVTETPVRESVQLREEHVRVERHAVDKPATEADMAALKEGSMELRETAEEPVVSKTARVVEEVEVGKEVTQRTEQIEDTVRRTEVEIEQLDASADDTDFRRHWQSAYGSSGGRYEDYDAAYRYGSTMAGSGQYKNYQWSDVEPKLRSDWEASHPGSAWEKVKDAVRYGAERVTGKH